MEKDDQKPTDPAKRLIRRACTLVTLIFWGLQYVELTLANWAVDPDQATAYLIPRALVVGIGILLTFALVEVTTIRAIGEGFRRRLLRSTAAVIAASALVATANYAVYMGWEPVPGIHLDPVQFMYQFFSWSWFFASIAAAMMAISYGVDVRDRERRLAEAQAAAHSAHVRALQYQLNPHFLFNTLNSVAALIAAPKPQAAELMVENLSDFLRTTLELDPDTDIPLEKELELQALYLAIEALRFPDRMAVRVEVPDELSQALVPGLITQPLIENAIKYGVARSREPVTLVIAAWVEAGSLALSVSNSAVSAPSPVRPGTGLGLANVAERLRARFGDAQSVAADVTAEGHYEVTIRMPLRSGE